MTYFLYQLYIFLNLILPRSLQYQRIIINKMIQNSKSLLSLSLQPNMYIPPLTLNKKEESARHLRCSLLHQPAPRTKASIDALKQNSDFLREKSLYRYYISKNQPRKSINKTEESLGAFHAQVSKQLTPQANDQKQQTKMKKSVLSQPGQTNGCKQRYFKRKTLTNQTNICTREMETAKINGIGALQQKKKKIIQQNEQEISLLRQQVSFILIENTKLKQQLAEREQQIEQLSDEVEALLQSNHQLTDQLKRGNNFNNAFPFQNNIQSQLQEKDRLIEELQIQIKYLQLQSLVLRRNRGEVNLLKTSIPRNTEQIQQKIHLFNSQIGQNRKNRCSQSLRISNRNSSSVATTLVKENDKDAQGGRTAERTPDKKRECLQNNKAIMAQHQLQ